MGNESGGVVDEQGAVCPISSLAGLRPAEELISASDRAPCHGRAPAAVALQATLPYGHAAVLRAAFVPVVPAATLILRAVFLRKETRTYRNGDPLHLPTDRPDATPTTTYKMN